MSDHRIHPWSAIIVVVSFLGGCAGPTPPIGAKSHADEAVTKVAPLVVITQLRYGDEAEYALCVEPACPRTTYKTKQSYAELAVAEQAGNRLNSAASSSERILVHFAVGSHRLSPTAKQSLKTIIPDARAASGIVLSGRTDNRGTHARNLVLSMKRAIAVREFLARRLPGGTPRFDIDARANCCYIADNASEAGRSANRRVEVILDFGMRQVTR